MKQTKDGLDVLEDIPRFSQQGFESIPEDDLERLKWAGIFHRKPTRPHFMMRVRITNGIATTDQVRVLAAITERFGRGIADITTRQQIELRWLRIEDMPEVREAIASAGLTSLQTGMDNVRNVVGCPLAGIYPNELLDASPLCRQFSGMFVGDRDYTNLPRKFNVTITGCLDNCTHNASQDVALVPATKTIDGAHVRGFNVLAGGKMGSGGFTPAQPLDAFVPPEDAAAICRAVVLVFRDHGPREARSQARLAFLIDQWGIERLRAAVEESMGRELFRAGIDARSDRSVDHIGITPQREPGLCAVGLLVPVGRVQTGQLREAARLADEYGRGEVRLTTGQNLIIPHVPEDRVPALCVEPLLQDWRWDPTPVMRGLVACTGTEFCNLALIETKQRALGVARALEERLPQDGPITIHWSGCPAGCGNHHLADFGLQGKRIRLNGEVVEAVTILAGGRPGREPRPAQVVREDVPCDEHLVDVLEQVIRSSAPSPGPLRGPASPPRGAREDSFLPLPLQEGEGGP